MNRFHITTRQKALEAPAYGKLYVVDTEVLDPMGRMKRPPHAMRLVALTHLVVRSVLQRVLRFLCHITIKNHTRYKEARISNESHMKCAYQLPLSITFNAPLELHLHHQKNTYVLYVRKTQKLWICRAKLPHRL